MTRDVPEQCRNILARFVPEGDFHVVVLEGNGNNRRLRQDIGIMADALRLLDT